MIIVTRPTSSLPARGAQRAAAPAPQQERRSAHHSVTSSAAVQHGVTSPSPAGRVATEDVGQLHVGGQRSLLRSSDNRPAGNVVLPPLNVLEEEGGNTNASAPATEETTQGADARVILDAHIDVRVTRTELDAVRCQAREFGVKPSTWVRAVLRDALDARSHAVEALAAHAAVPMPSPEKARAVEQLRRVGVNLNQVVRAGTAVSDELLREVLAVLAEVRALFGDEVSL